MTPSAASDIPRTGNHWSSPVEHRQYDRFFVLSSSESGALDKLVISRYRWGDDKMAGSKRIQSALSRLLTPLREAMAAMEGEDSYKDLAMATILRACQREKAPFWAWNQETWGRVLGANQAAFFRENGLKLDAAARQYMIAAAYLLGCPVDLRALGDFKRLCLACKVFGSTPVEAAVTTINSVLGGWGYASSGSKTLATTLCELLLFNRSPYLEDLTPAYLEEFRRHVSVERRARIYALGRALAALGIFPSPLAVAPIGVEKSASNPGRSTTDDVDPNWLAWVHRWESTSTLTRTTRRSVRIELLKAGRWLQAHHPTVTSPEQWDRELGISYVAAVDRMQLGDYVSQRYRGRARQQGPITPRTKSKYIGAMRVFIRDCQEWGWIPIRFDPSRVFSTPRSVKALIGPSPRTIAPDIWARLLWAGLNLTVHDLPQSGNCEYYPIEMLRALATVWLFAGLRSDEITRLRLGCVRWQQDDVCIPATTEMLPRNAVCLLDVPVNKTGTAFAKPVDPVVGEAISAWEKVRPIQPASSDRKTGELVYLLFSYRARPLPREYLNGSLIPLLCRKAQVPLKDVRGSITSHRARSTIASQLFNAREPMSLFELQAWLGHRSPATTQNYVALEPTRLAKAYADAGYFARNVRAIEVLIDQDAVKSAAAANGEPWRFYDLGHGLCSYEFFEQCPHRMACAKCDFYDPKGSSRDRLLEAKSNLLRLLQEVPLTEDERAAVDGDIAALERLVTRLTGQPTPSGKTREELKTCTRC